MSGSDSSPHLLHSTAHFRIEHAVGYRIAGLLFVIPKRRVSQFTDLDDDELTALGATLRIAHRAVGHVMHPLNIYCARFGESHGPLHFHIFPRTDAITRAYFDDNPDERIIDAPRLMSWANRKFSTRSGPSHGDVSAATEAFRRYFESSA